MKCKYMMLMVLGLLFFPWPVSSAEAGGQVGALSPEVPVQGDALLDESKAREALQSFLPWLSEDLKLTASLEDSSGDGIIAWVFEDSRRPGSGSDSFRASINARNGELFSFYYRPPRSQYKTREIAFSRDAAYRIAVDYLNKMQGGRISDLEFEADAPLPGAANGSFSTDYVFTWNRKVNGIVVGGDGATIGVDAYTGQVNQYWSNWHEGAFPSAQEIRSREDMEKDVIERLGLYLGYISEQERYGYSSGTGQLFPVYCINKQWLTVDARSGMFLDFQGMAVSDEKARLLDKTLLPKNSGQLLAVESNSAPAPSLESIRQTVQKYMSLLGYSGEVRRAGGGFGGYPGGAQEYWSYAPAKDGSSLRVDIEVHTGQFVGFSREGAPGSIGAMTPIDRQQALEKAREAVIRFNPELEDQLILYTSFGADDDSGRYSFSFARMIDGLPYSGQGLFMSVDRSSGEIVNYHLNWPPVKTASHPSLIGEARARQILESAQLLTPGYTYPFSKSGIPGDTPQLAYRFKEILGVDAVSGEVLYNPFGQDSITQGDSPGADGSLSPSLELLHQNGLAMPAGSSPDDPVSRRTVIQALLFACRSADIFENMMESGPGSTATPAEQRDIDLLNRAVSAGIIDKNQAVDLNQAASRQEAAVWAVKLLGYQDIAEMPARVEIAVQDTERIPSRYWNYMGIAYGLGLLKEREPGHLYPEQDLNWTELGDMIARFIPLTGARTAGPGYSQPFRIYGRSSIQMR